VHEYWFSHALPRETRNTYGFGKSLWTVVDPSYEEALLGIIYPNDAGTSQMLDKFGEGNPSSGIHVKVVLVPDVFLIDVICFHALSTAAETQV
jgi:hypothetical protein